MDDYNSEQFKQRGKAERSAAEYKAAYGGSCNIESPMFGYYYDLIFEAASDEKLWAMYTLAYMHEYGISVKRDMMEAFSWYEKGAKLGDDNCQLEMFYFYKYGKANEYNMHLAVFWLKQSANKGNPVAQYNLALIYLEGAIEEVNIKEAVYWLKQSASCGYRDAMFYLGELAENGVDGKPNYNVAYRWYLKASKLNCTEAQLCLARLVFSKISKNEKFVKQAVTILKKLIKLGNDEALYLLGSYYKSLGGAYFEQAFILLSEAANTYGNKAAIYEIGEMYETGLGLPRDSAKALEYFNKVMNLI